MYRFIGVAIVFQCLLILSNGEICFRKYRGDGVCKGKMSRDAPSASTCCSRGNAKGYAVVKKKIGKNSYKCVACPGTGPTTETPVITTTEYYPPEWSDWTSWSSCSAPTCEHGFQTRTRNCTNGPGCSGINFDVQICYYCPVDGQWTPWSSWTDCSASCEGGEQSRRRECTNPPPSGGGSECDGESVETRVCNDHICVVDGGWSEWSRYSSCSQSCGDGTEYRTRTCNNPPPKNGGQMCDGSELHTISCHRRACPINGGWSSWSVWTSCTVTCGTGVIERQRSCDSPRARFGGLTCPGSVIETSSCEVPTPCPVDGGWSRWSRWGNCYAREVCGEGHQWRSRSCTSPRPRHRGNYCPGHGRESQQCKESRRCETSVTGTG